MSSKKGVGSSKNGRDSEAKRLGLKVGAGEKADQRLQQGSIRLQAPTSSRSHSYF